MPRNLINSCSDTQPRSLPRLMMNERTKKISRPFIGNEHSREHIASFSSMQILEKHDEEQQLLSFQRRHHHIHHDFEFVIVHREKANKSQEIFF